VNFFDKILNLFSHPSLGYFHMFFGFTQSARGTRNQIIQVKNIDVEYDQNRHNQSAQREIQNKMSGMSSPLGEVGSHVHEGPQPPLPERNVQLSPHCALQNNFLSLVFKGTCLSSDYSHSPIKPLLLQPFPFSHY
jgi:hypothetical protein